MSRWQVHGNSIAWQVDSGAPAHSDHIEMSGLGVSYILTYGTRADGRLLLSRHAVWPRLRTIPNNPHASFQRDIDELPVLCIDGDPADEFPTSFLIDGVVRARSETGTAGIRVERVCYPSTESGNIYERILVHNGAGHPVQARLEGAPLAAVAYERGTKGVYVVEIRHDGEEPRTLPPEGSTAFHVTISARIANRPPELPGPEAELMARYARVRALCGAVTLDTGCAPLDLMFRFAMLRAGESIFDTLGGKFHSPGGGAFYAATWCNDEIEYAGPWFACTGDDTAIEASVNAYRGYMAFMSDAGLSIPSSIIAEGLDIWDKDRGDEAMYAYGASLFALLRGDEPLARELYPAIAWCIAFCLRRKNAEGVIVTESDELEGRFSSGNANLSSSSLLYGALTHAARLADDLGETADRIAYEAEAQALRAAIEEYFGCTLYGYATYRYHENSDKLRSWSCLPLCMGIMDRADGVVRAIFSPHLWTKDGALTEEGTHTVWDRSTLYAFRSAFLAGRDDLCMDAFLAYCGERLLGDHVPYAFEAYPEGGKRHLSAESALFCRVVTEGILGLRPLGLRRFACTPRLPRGLDHLYLRGLRAFGAVLDFEIDSRGYAIRAGGNLLAEGPLGVPVEVALD